MEERLYQPEEQKEEKYYQLRPQICGLFFYNQESVMGKFTVIKNNEEFRKVYTYGKSRANKLLVMYILENGTDTSRFGITVSKKVGNSIVRHRLTRLIRESIRLNTGRFLPGYDIVIVARTSLKGKGYKETESALLHVSGIHGIIKNVSEND